MEMVEAVALLDYHGKTSEELSFRINEKFILEKRINSQWWYGHIVEKNQSGLIPDNSIKLQSNITFSSSSSIDRPLVPSCSIINDVLPNSNKVHEHSTSPKDLNRTLHEIFSNIDQCFPLQDIDTPDLVLNLPIVHSTIIIDVQPMEQVKKKIPPLVMKKSEKTLQLIQRLGLISLSTSSKVTEV